jgi:glycosyltransferase involved in cell wall biosynthesis
MAKILFVVHRYYPYPGGSENYVRWMAEGMKNRNHDVAVYSDEHKGDQNGIRVTSDRAILLEKWDLIIVHGADVHTQNFVLANGNQIPSPIVYMIILPSDSRASQLGMQNAKYLAWSTEEDIQHIYKNGHHDKAVNIRHGIPYNFNALPRTSDAKEKLCKKYSIDPSKRIFLSCGGYWPNKKMKELAEVFLAANVPNTVLVTTGYGGYQDLIPNPVEGKVYPIVVEEQEEIGVWMTNSDLYIMHSEREGFGLVLLEAMQRFTPWAARHMAGAAKLVYANGPMSKPLGFTYGNDTQLIEYLKSFSSASISEQTAWAHRYVLENHMITHTCDDIEAILEKEKKING